MDRRDFLKTIGVLAITAPLGLAALKPVQAKPEIETPPTVESAQDEQDCSGSMMYFPNIRTCTDIDWVPEDREVMRGKVLTSYLERFALKH